MSRLHPDRHRKRLLAPAGGAEVGHLPVQARQLEQALGHAHRLAQRQIGQALDRQTELNCRVPVHGRATPLAAGTTVPAHILVQPDQQLATRFQCRRMGLTDFMPENQDLTAVSMLRGLKVIDKIQDGDIEAGLFQASKQWAALPVGRNQAGRYNQPYVKFERFEATYKAAGGTTK